MLVALNNKNERVTASKYLERNEEYYCPVCKQKVILRKGLMKIPHFAHQSNDIFCKGAGESYIHNAMKLAMKTVIEKNNDTKLSELEYIITNDDEFVVADYYFEKHDRSGRIRRCAVECVHEHKDLSHFLEKNRFYLKNNVYPVWVFDSNLFMDKEEVRVNAILKEAHKYYFGKVWTVDYEYDEVYAVHFDKVERYVEEWNGHGGYWKTLRDTKSPLLEHVPKFDVNSFTYKKVDDFCDYNRLVAGPFLKPFWK